MPPTVRPALRLAAVLIATLLVLPGLLRPLGGHPLDLVNLVFHEAGHVLFAWGGETLTLLGGSLLQVAVPLVCVLAFLRRGDRFAAGLTGLWLAESLAGVAAYVRDAPTRTLDLITGDPDTHDWWQLLGGWGRLDLADPLGRLLMFLAFALLLGSVFLAAWDALHGRG